MLVAMQPSILRLNLDLLTLLCFLRGLRVFAIKNLINGEGAKNAKKYKNTLIHFHAESDRRGRRN